jgi:hypothetical protein
MNIRIYEIEDNKWTVEFSQDNRIFTLDYYPDTEEQANWMVDQLKSAFDSFKRQKKGDKICFNCGNYYSGNNQETIINCMGI